jgi:hypothetical protein
VVATKQGRRAAEGDWESFAGRAQPALRIDATHAAIRSSGKCRLQQARPQRDFTMEPPSAQNDAASPPGRAAHRRRGRRAARTINQCGTLVLTLAKPESLLVPVAKDLATAPPALDPLSHEVDHFLCYKAKAQKKRGDGTLVATLPKRTQVDAADQFQTRRYDVKKITRLCVPVTTAGMPTIKAGVAVPIVATALRHPAGHLVCYQVKPASKTIPQNGCGPVDPKNKGTKIVPKQPKHQKRVAVHVNGPLGTATLDTANEVELCIPSLTTLP